jgi:hypothetical protein
MRRFVQALLALVSAMTLFYTVSQLTAQGAVGPCPIFPADNVWNTRVDSLPVHPQSAAWINSIGPSTGMHADFGAGQWEGAPIGIPYTTANSTTPRVAVTFDYDDESDPGPYAIPANAPIEGGPSSDGDRHVLVVETDQCKLYEMWSAYPQADGSWHAGSGAVFDLRSNALRPAGWTSADAAGLPVLAGLARYDEVATGVISHALRFTVQRTQRQYIWPARHFASTITDPNVPPMGARFRLKSSFDITPYAPQVRVILTALKQYGMFIADNGSNWFLSGAPNAGWDDNALSSLRNVLGSNFEAVDESGWIVNANSGQVKGGPTATATAATGATPTPTRTATAAAPTATRTATAAPTATRTATPQPQSPPSAPRNLNASRASGGGINLSWAAPSSSGSSPITGYRIYRGTTPGGEGSTPIASVGNVTTYRDRATVRGVTYYYKVTAVNAAGEGPASNEDSARAR